ncbi:MAG: hypothetical protein WEC00_14670, partial [Dongiaceae bacterium]
MSRHAAMIWDRSRRRKDPRPAKTVRAARLSPSPRAARDASFAGGTIAHRDPERLDGDVVARFAGAV